MIIVSLMLLGMCLRIAFLIAMQTNWPGWSSPTIDALYHHLWALKIADGDIIGGGPYFRAPLYPLLLGLLYAVFGVNFTIVTLIQQLIGLCAIPLVFVIAKRYFNLPVAYAAAAITTINGVFIYFESQLLLDFLTIVFMLLFIWTIDKAYSEKKPLLYLYTGIIVGIFAITRPNILAILPLIVIWIMMLHENLSSRIRKSLLLLAGTLILILPVTLRNIVVGHDTVLIASQGGVNYYIGNNEKADGYTALLPGFGHGWHYSDAEYQVSEETGRDISTIKPSEVSSFYYDKSIKYILADPWDFIKLQIKKLYIFWNYYEVSNNNNLYFLTEYIGMSFIPLFLFAIISPLGMIGAVLCFFKGRRYWILPIVIFGYMATVVAFFVTARFRLPLVPLLTILASYTLFRFYDYIKARDYRKSAAIVAVILILGLFSWTNLYDHHDKTMAMAHYSLGNMLMRKGDYDKARQAYQQANVEGACVSDANINLGVIAFYEKNYDEAKRYFLDELIYCGENNKAFSNLSLLARLEGDYMASIAWSDSSISNFPSFKDSYINRILSSFAADNQLLIDQSVDLFLLKFPDNAAANYYYALNQLRLNNDETAKAYLEKALVYSDRDFIAEYDLSEIYSSSLPYGYDSSRIKGKSLYQLGLLSASENDFSGALAKFKQAILYLPDDPDALVNLALASDQTGDYESALANYKKAIEIDSANAVYRFNYAMTLGKTGNYTKAIEMLRKAVELDPEFTQARKILENIEAQIR